MQKFPWIPALALAATLVNVNLGHAADTGVIAAALPDEASECRYLTQLANARRFISQQWLICQQRKICTGWWENGHLVVEAARTGTAFDEAIAVIRAKHDQMPKCFEGFADLTDIDQFRTPLPSQ